MSRVPECFVGPFVDTFRLSTEYYFGASPDQTVDVFRGQVLPTLQGIFTNAKNVARDRKLLVDQMKTNRWAAEHRNIRTHNLSLRVKHESITQPALCFWSPRMPVPPQGTDEEKEQLNLLRRRIDFEKANPEHVDAAALKVLKSSAHTPT